MATPTARTLRPEDEISHYRIVGPLGAGGMGEVYLAQDRSLERNVALKILPPDLVRSEERVRRFVLEAKSASSLSHPNIVTIYEIGQDAVRSSGEPESAPMHFISMELVSGKTLSTLIHEEKADVRTLLGYLAQAAEGLAKAHAAGIVHRDLKPGNIMVSSDGFAKVLDFGLAKLTERRDAGPEVSSAPTMGADVTREGIIVGTAGYMAPEQIQGKAVDHRADIFALGCILYEAATRRKPFAAETGVETMHKILHEKPVPVEELNDTIPAELRRLIRRCLAKSPDQRQQSMKDLAIELREIVDEYDSLSPSASSGSIATGTAQAMPARRGPSLALIGGAVLVGLAGIAVAWWGLWRGGEARPDPGQDMRITALTSRGDVVSCALSSDGRYLAYLCGVAANASLRVRQVATGGDVEVVPSAFGLENPTFSADGNYLFYSARDPEAQGYRALYQVPSLGGTPQRRAFDVDSRVSFSPDARQIVFWRGAPQLRKSFLVVVELETGKERILATLGFPELFAGSPMWTLDGKRIVSALYEPGTLSSSIAWFDPSSGRRQNLAKLPQVQIENIAWRGDGDRIVVSASDYSSAPVRQVFLLSSSSGRLARITNDFNDYSNVSGTTDQIAAVRSSELSNLWIGDLSGGAPRRITSSTSFENSPWGGTIADSGIVVYGMPSGSDFNLWSVSAGGGEPRALTTGRGYSFRPFGARGVVLFDREQGEGVHVWRMDPDGAGARQLTRGVTEQVQNVSSDGRWLIFSNFDSTSGLRVASTQDGRLSSLDKNYRFEGGFSRDGERVLLGVTEFDSSGTPSSEMVVVPSAGGAPLARVRLPRLALAPSFSPDGQGFSFINGADPHGNLYRQPFGGGPPSAVTRFTDGRVTGYRWSPDGTKLALLRRVGDSVDAWITEADGTRPVPITRLSSEDVLMVRWFPDSRRLLLKFGKRLQDVVLIRKAASSRS